MCFKCDVEIVAELLPLLSGAGGGAFNFATREYLQLNIARDTNVWVERVDKYWLAIYTTMWREHRG